MDPIRLIIADDHAVLRAGLRLLLESQPDLQVVGEAGDGWETLQLAEQHKPDVILLDLSMPGPGGLEVIKEIKRRVPRAKVLVLTMHEDEGYLRSVLKAGGSGYVVKKAADTELLSAIRSVHRGGVYIDPSLTRGLVEEILEEEAPAKKLGEEVLSEREREVLVLLALGHTNQEIAEKLCLSVKTVETYRARIQEKLQLRSRAALVRYALERGLLKAQ
ncbi:MAG: response regulator transcription factor [Armatimonadota bacterium]|nr:response regulator transcription factor [Armatimonadota bacterium]MDR5702499.1 response regulator transcription factor [Armatimonadota bacterium]MDR7434055.1 response regulator transcription factor [Armatimonadota bacterium]